MRISDWSSDVCSSDLLEKVDLVDNVTEVFRSWREGTVIRSWLLDLLVAALDETPNLEGIAGYADDSGEGRWTVEAGIENAVATPAITAALFARRSEEHTSELQSLMLISYAVFCLKKKNKPNTSQALPPYKTENNHKN